ncbi:MAG TPA: VWA domain-containing protein [Thermoanaerobaculia bacterium]|nr:VWA domain-containing protein [Thermoanaerobaculia bacterium]
MNMIAAVALLLQVASQQPYIETFEVRLHNFDVVVTDAQGRPVSGLTKNDFVVLEDGKPQEITNFAEYSESEGALTADGAPEATAAPAAERPPRRFIFFIDEMALHPNSRRKLLNNAATLMEDAMRDGDVATVIRPVGDQNIVIPWTDDRNAVEKALRAAVEENHTRVDTQAAAELRFLELQLADSASRQERQFARRQYADMVRRRVEQRLGQIRSLVASLAGTEGRKVLVLMTASLAARPGEEASDVDDQSMTEGEVGATLTAFRDLSPAIADLGRVAAASGVTIYSIQPDVPLEYITPGREAARRQLSITSANPATPRRTVRAVLPTNIFNKLLDNTQATMASLAETTGGRWFRGDGTIDDGFRQIGDDLRSYYSLAYRAKGEAGGARNVVVRVRERPELRVRTRSEVIEKSPTREMTDLVVASLMYPRTVNELGIRATPLELKKNRNLFTIPVETLIPMEKLTFLGGQDGKYHATFTVHYAAAGEKSDFSAGQERRQDVTITEDEMLALKGKMFRYTSDLVVAPGKVRIAVGVLDQTSKLSGFQSIELWAR